MTAKILVDFIRDFTSLAECQLKAIREIMEDTVQEIMSSVGDLSNTATKSNLIRQSEPATNGLTESQRGDSLEDHLRKSGGELSKQIEAMGHLNADIQAILAKVVGSVSMDDVLGQRLNHIINSIAVLRRGIREILSDLAAYRTQKAIKVFKNRILTDVYRSYTSEDEKEIFHKIFGQPKSQTQAS